MRPGTPVLFLTLSYIKDSKKCYCCIVAHATLLPVSQKYKSRHVSRSETEAEIETEEL